MEAFRIYNILTRPQGGAAWSTAASLTGIEHFLRCGLAAEACGGGGAGIRAALL